MTTLINTFSWMLRLCGILGTVLKLLSLTVTNQKIFIYLTVIYLICSTVESKKIYMFQIIPSPLKNVGSVLVRVRFVVRGKNSGSGPVRILVRVRK